MHTRRSNKGRGRATRVALLILAFASAIGLLASGNLLVLRAMGGWGQDAESLLAFVNAIGVLGMTGTIVGIVICWRVPGNPIGVLLITGSLMVMSIFVAWPLVVVREAAGGTTLVDGIIAWWGMVALLPAIFILGPSVGLLFPDGRLPGAGWRPPFAALTCVLAASVLLQTIAPWATGEESQPVPNMLAIPGMPMVVSEIGGALAAVAVFSGFALSVAGILARWRRAAGVERAQLKWLAAALAVVAIVFPISFATDAGPADLIDLASVLTAACIPVAIGIAILRYRLYDIDRIISRALAWAIVSGLLVAVFGGAILVLQGILDTVTRGDTLAVAASTLLAFALFQPLRQRVQRAVDRRFDRARYDAERTAAAFADRLRDQVDLDALASDIRATATQAVRPTSASVWLPPRDP